jgi:hypothetical protein
MRLFWRRGKERVNGDELVELRVQKTKTAIMATARAVQLKEDVMVELCGCGLFGVRCAAGRQALYVRMTAELVWGISG